MKLFKVLVSLVIIWAILEVGEAFSSNSFKLSYNFEKTQNSNENDNLTINDDAIFDESDSNNKFETEERQEDFKSPNEFNDDNILDIESDNLENKAKEIQIFESDNNYNQNFSEGDSLGTDDIKSEYVQTTTAITKKVNKKLDIWEKIGISKEDYYFKPAHSWERVDFQTYEQCLEFGYSYQGYLDGEESFNCREITSLSGNFLGVMFETEINTKDRS